MNQRLGGLFVVCIVLFFLWLYDTGRWTGISSVLSGGTSNLSGNLLGSLSGSAGLATPTSYSSSGTGASYSTQLFCNSWPTACPYNSLTGSSSSSSSSSSNPLGALSSIGSWISGLF